MKSATHFPWLNAAYVARGMHASIYVQYRPLSLTILHCFHSSDHFNGDIRYKVSFFREMVRGSESAYKSYILSSGKTHKLLYGYSLTNVPQSILYTICEIYKKYFIIDCLTCRKTVRKMYIYIYML